MKLRVLVQMDPIERINIAGDSTFALMLEAQARGHELAVYTPDRLSQTGQTVHARVRPCEVRDVVGDHASLGAETRIDVAQEADVVLLRQDPPVDNLYVSTTYMLERVHPKTLVVNDPVQVRNSPEKIFVLDYAHLMPPTLVTRDKAEVAAFREEHKDIVVKPLFGHGGSAVFRLTSDDLNYGSLLDFFSTSFREPWMVQKFLPNVSKGDKRILMVDGEFAGAVNRVPAAGDLRSNMIRGGAAHTAELSSREREICETIGPELKRRGLIFVGFDVIDGFLTEINVTSPTGIRAVKRLGGPDAAAAAWDAIERRVSEARG
jgi:glutathione synthase